jgi:hypothetical protein
MFVPGAAIPLAIATGFRYVFNELVNRPMEQEAEQGSGANDEELKRLSTAKVGEEQARIYDEIAARQESEATERTWSDWLLDPNNERLTDRQLGKLEDARSSRAAAARQRSSGQVRAEEEAREASRQRLLAHEKKSKEEERLKRLQNATDFYNSTQGVQTQRNGARTVTLRLPESSGDEMARQLAYNSNTATPNYG